MRLLSDYAINDLKLIYHLLHDRLPDDPMLMDSDLLQDLHAQWASWLNGGAQLTGL